ncbi:hypothetical protein A7U60_g2958 [Sanghuangporus baumii]|uniref:Uncharacterized protein n=1 Tax=Sanghuangporus baumii TaxID=108892 RepID=A0A9Q5I198_SANBA|nr:hypothetical protein A7U60_g2958 [Sanghuangporus baumii]
MVLMTRMTRMTKEGTTSTNTGEHYGSCTGLAAQVGNTDSSTCPAAAIYGDAHNQVESSHHQVMWSEPGQWNKLTKPEYLPSVHPQLKRGQKRQRDEGDNNKENVAVAVQRGTPPKRCVRHRAANTNETSTIPTNENIPVIVEVMSGPTFPHHVARDIEASDEVAFANVLGGVTKPTVISPLLPVPLERNPKKTRNYLGLIALDNELLQILMKFSEVKKAEGTTEHPGVTNV